MIVGLVTDFEMTFTGDLTIIVWQNNDFVFKFQNLKKKKIAVVLSNIQVSNPGHLGPHVVYSGEHHVTILVLYV